jgi:hypothetical protein
MVFCLMICSQRQKRSLLDTESRCRSVLFEQRNTTMGWKRELDWVVVVAVVFVGVDYETHDTPS